MDKQVEFQKEKKKLLILLGIGVILAICFLIYAFNNVNMKNASFSMEDIIILIAIVLYPIGIVYGWRSMANLYKTIRGADKYKSGWNVGSKTVAITILNISVACAITICFGWIFGSYKAITTFMQLRKASKG
jgi:predicted Na+-dependent transporter